MHIEIRWVPTTTTNLKVTLELSPVTLKIDGIKNDESYKIYQRALKGNKFLKACTGR